MIRPSSVSGGKRSPGGRSESRDPDAPSGEALQETREPSGNSEPSASAPSEPASDAPSEAASPAEPTAEEASDASEPAPKVGDEETGAPSDAPAEDTAAESDPDAAVEPAPDENLGASELALDGSSDAASVAEPPSASESTSEDAGPAESNSDPSEADAEPAPAPAKKKKKREPTPAEKEKARKRAEIESFLGPSVKVPGGIPDGYIPKDSSIHPLLQVELDRLGVAAPLDLVLYLVRRHELDVLDIPIAYLVDKYLSMLNDLEVFDIEVAAEFIVLAAELSHIKSKMLLPADKGTPVEDPPDEVSEGDPRAELVRRLLEHQKYRDAASQLADRDQLGRDIFPRVPPPMDRAPELDPGLEQVSVFRLVELMARLLEEAPIHHEISYESFSISERIQYVSAFGEAHGGRFTLVALMSTIGSRAELVVTFIAVLEMAKMGLLRIAVEAFHAEAGAFRASTPTLEGGAEASVSHPPEPATPEDPPREAAAEGAALEEGEGAVEEAIVDSPPKAAVEQDPSAAGEGAADEGAVASGPGAGASPSVEMAPSPPELASEEGAPAESEAEMARAARAEAEALEALAAEARAESPVGDRAVDLPEDAARPEPDREPLPDIWVQMTEKRFQGDLVDDYR